MVGRRTSEDRLNRPKTVYFRFPAATCVNIWLHSATFGYIRPLSREEQRKNGGNRPQSVLSRAGIAHFRPLSAEQRAKIAHLRARSGSLPGLCRVPSGTCTYFRILTPRKRVDRARKSPRHGPLVGTQSGQKRRQFRTTIGPIKKID